MKLELMVPGKKNQVHFLPVQNSDLSDQPLMPKSSLIYDETEEMYPFTTFGKP